MKTPKKDAFARIENLILNIYEECKAIDDQFAKMLEIDPERIFRDASVISYVRLIISGGQGPSETMNEARSRYREIRRRYLVWKGLTNEQRSALGLPALVVQKKTKKK